jgi:hypothetical protein
MVVSAVILNISIAVHELLGTVTVQESTGHCGHFRKALSLINRIGYDYYSTKLLICF